MRYLNLGEILYIHDRIIRDSGGSHGIRNQGGLESAIALPRQVFGETELYPLITDKAGILCFSIVSNHPFVDGNKRTGHAAMETFLVLNGTEVSADVDEQERIFLALASGRMTREKFVLWLQNNVRHTEKSDERRIIAPVHPGEILLEEFLMRRSPCVWGCSLEYLRDSGSVCKRITIRTWPRTNWRSD